MFIYLQNSSSLPSQTAHTIYPHQLPKFSKNQLPKFSKNQLIFFGFLFNFDRKFVGSDLIESEFFFYSEMG